MKKDKAKIKKSGAAAIAAIMSFIMVAPCASYAQSATAPAPQVSEYSSDKVIDIPYEPAKEKCSGIRDDSSQLKVIDETDSVVLYENSISEARDIAKLKFDESDPGYGAQFEEGSLPDLVYEAFMQRTFTDEEIASGSAQIVVDISSLNLSEADIGGCDFFTGYNSFFYDNPDLEYFSVDKVSLQGMNEVYTQALYNVTFLHDCAQRIRNFKSTVNDFEDQFDYDAPAVEQYKNIQDYISSHTEYNHDSVDDEENYYKENPYAIPHNAYGLLADHDKVVCEGYAKAYKALCNLVGLPCIFVIGYSTSDPGNFTSVDHAWNYIRISEKWYAIDCTWDDFDKNLTFQEETCYVNTTMYKYFCNNKYFTGDSSADHKVAGKLSSNSSVEFDFPELSVEEEYPGEDLQITDICLTPSESETSGNFIRAMVNYKKYASGWSFSISGYRLGSYVRNIELRIDKDTVITADGIVVPKGNVFIIDSADGNVYNLTFTTDGIAVTAEKNSIFRWDYVNIIGHEGANVKSPTIYVERNAYCRQGKHAGLDGYIFNEVTDAEKLFDLRFGSAQAVTSIDAVYNVSVSDAAAAAGFTIKSVDVTFSDSLKDHSAVYENGRLTISAESSSAIDLSNSIGSVMVLLSNGDYDIPQLTLESVKFNGQDSVSIPTYSLSAVRYNNSDYITVTINTYDGYGEFQGKIILAAYNLDGKMIDKMILDADFSQYAFEDFPVLFANADRDAKYIKAIFTDDNYMPLNCGMGCYVSMGVSSGGSGGGSGGSSGSGSSGGSSGSGGSSRGEGSSSSSVGNRA